VSYFSEETGDAYVGDVAGVRIPPSDFTLPPTPPPDIDVELWMTSLDTIDAFEPQRLCLTHFGFVDDVAGQLDAVRSTLPRWAALAAESGQERFVAEIEDTLRANADPDTAKAFIQAAPPDQLYLGLARYWAKKAEKETAR
jgi:glyoxylase-like metal-dependent hydrolase (beta-lactamase superfamily II)